MQRFLQFRLGCHGLPVATGRLAGHGRVDRSRRVCLCCNSGAVGDEKHLVCKCTALTPLRQRYASFHYYHRHHAVLFAQQDHLGVFRYVIDCLDFMHI